MKIENIINPPKHPSLEKRIRQIEYELDNNETLSPVQVLNKIKLLDRLYSAKEEHEKKH